MKTKDYKGITLIALIITIIVLLILAGVSISLVVGDNGVLGQAINATTATDVAETKEAIELAVIGYLDSNGNYTITDVEQAVSDAGATLDGTTVTTAKGNTFDISEILTNASDYVETISTTESYVGYYADVDGDEIVDGIIYADLMFSKSGKWGDVSYSYDAIESSKSYYIIQTNYEEDFGTADVIALVKGSTGNERFYVMALTDISSNTYYWYNEAMGSISSSTTSTAFGTGKTNTKTMIDMWNSGTYTTNENDLWGADEVQNGYNNGWFVPSAGEWAAFGVELNVGRGNYYGMNWQWTSSLYSDYYAWVVYTTRRRSLECWLRGRKFHVGPS